MGSIQCVARKNINPRDLKILGSHPILFCIVWEACLKWQETEPLDREMLLT